MKIIVIWLTAPLNTKESESWEIILQDDNISLSSL